MLGEMLGIARAPPPGLPPGFDPCLGPLTSQGCCSSAWWALGPLLLHHQGPGPGQGLSSGPNKAQRALGVLLSQVGKVRPRQDLAGQGHTLASWRPRVFRRPFRTHCARDRPRVAGKGLGRPGGRDDQEASGGLSGKLSRLERTGEVGDTPPGLGLTGVQHRGRGELRPEEGPTRHLSHHHWCHWARAIRSEMCGGA